MYGGAQYTIMTSYIQNESLSHLEKHEVKQLKTERQRSVTQCNKANDILEELSRRNIGFNHKTTRCHGIYDNIKQKTKRLKGSLEDFKEKHKDNEYYIKKTESALRNAEKNIINSLRRSKRIEEIRKAKKRIE